MNSSMARVIALYRADPLLGSPTRHTRLTATEFRKQRGAISLGASSR
jgi:hypothetical protein